MAEVICEIQNPDGGSWVYIGLAQQGGVAGSFSSTNSLGHRQVYLFGWLPNGAGPGVWRSLEGVDVEESVFRTVVAKRVQRVADLRRGEHRMTIQQRGGVRVRVRVRLRGR